MYLTGALMVYTPIYKGSDTAQKMKFSIKDFFSNLQEAADLVTFIEEIFTGKLHFLCSVGH